MATDDWQGMEEYSIQGNQVKVELEVGTKLVILFEETMKVIY